MARFNNRARYKRRKASRRKKSKGVPINYKENWKYIGRWKEKKVAPRKWRFTFVATKRRKAKTYGGLGKGSKGVWLIKAKQYVIKTNRGEYQTKMIGTKKSLGFNVKPPKSHYKGSRRYN